MILPNKRGIDFETKLLKVSDMLRPKFFDLGSLDSVSNCRF
jgi:hypothetical protein